MSMQLVKRGPELETLVSENFAFRPVSSVQLLKPFEKVPFVQQNLLQINENYLVCSCGDENTVNVVEMSKFREQIAKLDGQQDQEGEEQNTVEFDLTYPVNEVVVYIGISNGYIIVVTEQSTLFLVSLENALDSASWNSGKLKFSGPETFTGITMCSIFNTSEIMVLYENNELYQLSLENGSLSSTLFGKNITYVDTFLNETLAYATTEAFCVAGKLFKLDFTDDDDEEDSKELCPISITFISKTKVLCCIGENVAADTEDVFYNYKTYVVDLNNASFSETYDVTPAFATLLRKPCCYNLHLVNYIKDVSFVSVLASSSSSELSVVSINEKKGGAVCVEQSVQESDRAILPMDENTDEDTTPVGIALDCWNKEINLEKQLGEHAGEVDQKEYPLVYVLNNQGKMQIFAFLYANFTDININKAIECIPQSSLRGSSSDNSKDLPTTKQEGFQKPFSDEGKLKQATSGKSIFGQTASEKSSFGTPSFGSSGFGTSGFAQSNSKPNSETSTFEQQVSGGSIFGKPAFDQSGFGKLATEESVSGQSGFGQSGFGQSGFGQSGFGQSGFGQSGFGQSGFGQSGFGQSGFGKAAPDGKANTNFSFGAFGSNEVDKGKPSFGGFGSFGKTESNSPFADLAAQKSSSPFANLTAKKENSPFAVLNSDESKQESSLFVNNQSTSDSIFDKTFGKNKDENAWIKNSSFANSNVADSDQFGKSLAAKSEVEKPWSEKKGPVFGKYNPPSIISAENGQKAADSADTLDFSFGNLSTSNEQNAETETLRANKNQTEKSVNEDLSNSLQNTEIEDSNKNASGQQSSGGLFSSSANSSLFDTAKSNVKPAFSFGGSTSLVNNGSKNKSSFQFDDLKTGALKSPIFGTSQDEKTKESSPFESFSNFNNKSQHSLQTITFGKKTEGNGTENPFSKNLSGNKGDQQAKGVKTPIAEISGKSSTSQNDDKVPAEGKTETFDQIQGDDTKDMKQHEMEQISVGDTSEKIEQDDNEKNKTATGGSNKEEEEEEATDLSEDESTKSIIVGSPQAEIVHANNKDNTDNKNDGHEVNENGEQQISDEAAATLEQAEKPKNIDGSEISSVASKLKGETSQQGIDKTERSSENQQLDVGEASKETVAVDKPVNSENENGQDNDKVVDKSSVLELNKDEDGWVNIDDVHDEDKPDNKATTETESIEVVPEAVSKELCTVSTQVPGPVKDIKSLTDPVDVVSTSVMVKAETACAMAQTHPPLTKDEQTLAFEGEEEYLNKVYVSTPLRKYYCAQYVPSSGNQCKTNILKVLSTLVSVVDNELIALEKNVESFDSYFRDQVKPTYAKSIKCINPNYQWRMDECKKFVELIDFDSEIAQVCELLSKVNKLRDLVLDLDHSKLEERFESLNQEKEHVVNKTDSLSVTQLRIKLELNQKITDLTSKLEKVSDLIKVLKMYSLLEENGNAGNVVKNYLRELPDRTSLLEEVQKLRIEIGELQSQKSDQLEPQNSFGATSNKVLAAKKNSTVIETAMKMNARRALGGVLKNRNLEKKNYGVLK
ncbi:Nucleoporin [Hanseniaspora osmophila]|uniref:Nucleoporin n=1 Tax=Hanseniaspora osmophila TaxID=56408 RepID=A0A1E5RNP1_9ASCO|nr:Nucleoporin [Hanseniaspora osmophila]